MFILKSYWKRNRKGFTLTELIVVIAIMAILMAVSIGVGTKQVKKSRIQECTSFLQTTATNIEEFIMDNGFLDITSTTDINTIQVYFAELADKYLNCDLDLNSIERIPDLAADPDALSKMDNFQGVRIKVTLYTDAWKMPYYLYYLSDYESASVLGVDASYFIVVASSGPNAFAADVHKYGYYNSATNGGVEDDIVIIMESRG